MELRQHFVVLTRRRADSLFNHHFSLIVV
jgi:hypothetical protein